MCCDRHDGEAICIRVCSCEATDGKPAWLAVGTPLLALAFGALPDGPCSRLAHARPDSRPGQSCRPKASLPCRPQNREHVFLHSQDLGRICAQMFPWLADLADLRRNLPARLYKLPGVLERDSVHSVTDIRSGSLPGERPEPLSPHCTDASTHRRAYSLQRCRLGFAGSGNYWQCPPPLSPSHPPHMPMRLSLYIVSPFRATFRNAFTDLPHTRNNYLF